jgi:hypothetical protein
MGRIQPLDLHLRHTVTALEELAALLTQLARAHTSIMALARGNCAQEPWRLYPGEYGIFDRKTHSQFYYHSHEAAQHEAGHFHTVRLFPDRSVHLVAISMSEDGWPQALFTVNGWAIGDAWEPPETLKQYIRRFHIGPSRGPAPLVRFINLMFEAFALEMEQLQDDKERTLRAYGAAHPEKDPLQDWSLEILSRVELDVKARLTRPAEVAKP